MILKREDYWIDNNGTPSDDDISMMIAIKKKNPENMIVLNWFFPYSGHYFVEIRESDNTVEDVRKRMPKIYHV